MRLSALPLVQALWQVHTDVGMPPTHLMRNTASIGFTEQGTNNGSSHISTDHISNSASLQADVCSIAQSNGQVYRCSDSTSSSAHLQQVRV
jgi:hypothetical protein